jgi:hypothetical protein
MHRNSTAANLHLDAATLPEGIDARIWLEARCFFSREDTLNHCWLWLLRTNGLVQALRLSERFLCRDDLLGEITACLDTPQDELTCHNISPGDLRLLPLAPVVPVTRWAISWGHPVWESIRHFAILLDQAVLATLGNLEVPGGYFGSVQNYNLLACLPPVTRHHRIQALQLFPPLVAPLLLNSMERPDMLGDFLQEDCRLAHFGADAKAPLLDAMDRGRDLIGALAHYWQIDRALVRSPLARVPWETGSIPAHLIKVIHAMPAHLRPHQKEEASELLAKLELLPAAVRSPMDATRLATAFPHGWHKEWKQLEKQHRYLGNRLLDSRNFLAAALDQCDWITLPSWLDIPTLALGWLARRGIASLLAATARWHAQPLIDRSENSNLPQETEPLFYGYCCEENFATEVTSASELIEEGNTMHHCAGGYWETCLAGPTRIVHLELANGTHATAQYDCNDDPDNPLFHLEELRGPCNVDCSQQMQDFAQEVCLMMNGDDLADRRREMLQEAQEMRTLINQQSNRQTIRLLDNQSRGELRKVINYCLKQPDWRAQENLLYRGIIAGFRYTNGFSLIRELAPGDTLQLVREPHNQHDPLAVRIDWKGEKLGYVPRPQNAEIAEHLDAGKPLKASIDCVRLISDFHPVDCAISLPAQEP